MASANDVCTASPITSERTCGPYCCATILIGTLPGRKPATLTVFASRARRFADLAFDGRDRHGDRQAALELAEGFEVGLHGRRILANFKAWCERGDSNPHGLPRRNLNPVRLPIPPLSQSGFAARAPPTERDAGHGFTVPGRGAAAVGVEPRGGVGPRPAPGRAAFAKPEIIVETRCSGQQTVTVRHGMLAAPAARLPRRVRASPTTAIPLRPPPALPRVRRPLRKLPGRIAPAAARDARRRARDLPLRARRRRLRRRRRRARPPSGSRRSTATARALDAIGAGATAGRAAVRRARRGDPRATGCRCAPFHDLLSAFRQDVVTTRYATFAELADYCAPLGQPGRPPAAAPVARRHAGQPRRQRRHLHRAAATSISGRTSASTGRKGRVYLPQEDLARFGVTEAAIARARCRRALGAR